MSNPVSVLSGKVAAADVTVSDMGLQGMIALRGDLSAKSLRAVCTKLTGTTFPDQGQIAINGQNALCWMSTDEVLLIVPYGSVRSALDAIAKALNGQHHLASNVSDARAMIMFNGPYVRDVLAKLAPVDLHSDSFQVGDFRRSRLGQVAAAFWMEDDQTFRVICFRSVAEYTFDLLAASAKAGPVGYLSGN